MLSFSGREWSIYTTQKAIIWLEDFIYQGKFVMPGTEKFTLNYGKERGKENNPTPG